METGSARSGFVSSRRVPAMPQGLPRSTAMKPAPRTPFQRSSRAAHSAYVNTDSRAYVEPNSDQNSTANAAGPAAFHGDEARVSNAVPAIQSRGPLRIREYRLARIGRTEC